MRKKPTFSGALAARARAQQKAKEQRELERLNQRAERRAKEREVDLELPPEVAAAPAAARCSVCPATIENTTQVLFERILRKRTRCDRCGEPLVFDEAVARLADQAQRVGGVHFETPTAYRCPHCDRGMERPLGELVDLVRRDRARCQVCGCGLELPQVVHEAVAARSAVGGSGPRRSVACPICDRGVVDEGKGEARVACGFCGARFGLLGEASRGVPPPLELPPAAPDELAPFTGRIYAQFPLAAELLHARALRGEVTVAEAIVLAARVEAFRAWTDPEPTRLPLPPEEAAPILASLLFPGALYHTDKQDLSEGGTLFVDLGGSTQLDPRKVANQLHGLLDPLSNGGRSWLNLDLEETVSTDLCIGLTAVDNGWSALTLGVRRNGGKVKALPKKLDASLREAFTRLPLALGTYHHRHALFGPWAAGSPLFLLNPDAAQDRLGYLGLPPARYGTALGLVAPE
ncbi:MAG: hypothetical protein R3F62_00540 [Planctomycetota bacterium]